MTNPTSTAIKTFGGLSLPPSYAGAVARVLLSVAVLTAINERSGQTSMSTGSAFCVDSRGYFLTALHYTDGCVSSFIAQAEIFHTRLVAVDRENDLALFAVKQPTSQFVPVTFSTAALDKGAAVVGLGYPAAGIAVSVQAYVCGFLAQLVNGVDPDDPGIQCPSLPSAMCFAGSGLELAGFSGGPMVNGDGQVVAVTSMGDGDEFVAGTTAGAALAFIAANIK